MSIPDRSVPANVRMVIHHDPESGFLRIVGVREGPAGSAALDLGPEIRVSMDYADPGVVNEILLMPEGEPSEELEGLLTMLIGDDARAAVLAVLRHGADRPVRLDTAPVPITSLPEAGVLGRVAVLQALFDDGWLSPLGAAAALLEASRLLAGSHWDVAGLAESHVSSAIPILLANGDDRLTLPPGPEGAALWNLCRWAVTTYPSADGIDRLGMALGPQPGSGNAHGPSPAPVLLPVEVPVAPAPEEPSGPWATLDGCEVHVHADRFRPGLWARAFRNNSARTLLAMAPLRPIEPLETGLARLLVPPGLGRADLIVDLTDEPETPRPSDTLRLVRRSLAAGRLACRHERFDRPELAASEWAACAEAWRTADDPGRAAAAERLAAGDDAPDAGSLASRRIVLREPFLADRLSPPADS